MQGSGAGKAIFFAKVNFAKIFFINHLTIFGDKYATVEAFVEKGGVKKITELAIIIPKNFLAEFLGCKWIVLQ